MATQRGGGDIFDFENMSDDEIREVVLEQLRESPNIGADDVQVIVRDGHVTLSGRVGTDGEAQVAEALLDDVLGIDDYTSELVVGEQGRYELPEAADDAEVAQEALDDSADSGDDQQSDTAEHLAQDDDAQMYGTHDLNEALREGATYIPPDSPGSDGYDSRENH